MAEGRAKFFKCSQGQTLGGMKDYAEEGDRWEVI